MDAVNILGEIDHQIARLQQARALLAEGSRVKVGGRLSQRATKPRRRRISAEGRAKIAAAQRARWAKLRKSASK